MERTPNQQTATADSQITQEAQMDERERLEAANFAISKQVAQKIKDRDRLNDEIDELLSQKIANARLISEWLTSELKKAKA